MTKSKFKKIVQDQVKASTEYWADKPKLSEEELAAVAAYAEKKGKAIDVFFASEKNRADVTKLLSESPKK